jgi:HD-GYP domain-containing protein (c-di-GMP phosphodiesterase class II)
MRSASNPSRVVRSMRLRGRSPLCDPSEVDSRLAEIVASLSLATEAAAGVPPETAARAAIVATRVAESMGGGTQERQDVYYASLLRYIGCTSFAHETAWYGGGDDIALLRTMTPADSGSLADVAKHIVGGAAKGAGAVTRARSVARLLGDPSMPKRLAEAHCNQAVRLAAHLGAAARVTDVLGQTYERFDGKGLPGGLRGDAISPLARVMHVAYCAVLHGAFEGSAAALEIVRARSGGELDPAVCDAFMRGAAEHLQLIGATSVWDQVAAAEPSPRQFVSSERVPQVARAFAHFVDLKSPYTIGHSVGVSQLCEAALGRAGASDEEREQGRLAGFLHDLGRASVPNGIWDKPAPLNVVERERVEQHVYQSERVLARAEVLAPLAKLVGAHHERIDGSGYYRGSSGALIPRVARYLAAADVYQAMCEERAFRPAHDTAAAAEALTKEAATGRLDRDAVGHVLEAAGHARPQLRSQPTFGLSEREVEVLVLLARGLTNKQIGKRLFISPRTVGHHVAHIYDKTAVKTRAAAALFAAENDLVAPPSK